MSRRLPERYLNKLKAAANALGWTLVVSRDLEGALVGSHAFCKAATEKLREPLVAGPSSGSRKPARSSSKDVAKAREQLLRRLREDKQDCETSEDKS